MNAYPLKKLAMVRLVIPAVILSIAGCASPGEKTVVGGVGGAAGGSIIGAAVGGTKGAAIGAATGAVVGGAIGNYLDRQAQELAQVAETHRTEQGILVRLKNDLLFDTGKDALRDTARGQLQDLGQILAKYKDDRIRVQGFADNTGSEQLNLQLSERRADAVAGVLRQQGVREQQILTSGLGEGHPIDTNSTPEGRAKNRRVELYIDVARKDAKAKG